jgi:pyruvyltransferase
VSRSKALRRLFEERRPLLAPARRVVRRTATLVRPTPAWGRGDPLPVHWYQSTPNFGDALAKPLAEHYFRRPVRWVPPTTMGKILSIGSVLKHVQATDLVVGSGLLEPTRTLLPARVRVIALRGPLTAALLGLDPARDDVALGDPGLLAAELFGVRASSSLDGPIGLVPHYTDHAQLLEDVRTLALDQRTVKIIDVRASPREVVESIASVRSCISSSLHGLVIADSLGIPSTWLRGGRGVTGERFKFEDYYLGTGRSVPERHTLVDAVECALANEVRLDPPDAAGIRGAMLRAGEIARSPRRLWIHR